MVVLEEIGALRRTLVARIARFQSRTAAAIAMGPQLQLDDLRTHFSEQAGAGGASDELRNVEHAVSAEHGQVRRHGRCSYGLGDGWLNRLSHACPVGFVWLRSSLLRRTAR